jgi:hypothetical protein
VAVNDQAQQTYCPFVGNSVCGKLTATTDKGEADLRYVNPNAQWSQYAKVLIEPVSYWGGDSSQLSAADQRMLVNYFSKALNEQLSKKFKIVDQPGPGVMVVSVALDDATAATPGCARCRWPSRTCARWPHSSISPPGRFPSSARRRPE